MAKNKGDGYYDMAPEELARLPDEIKMALGLMVDKANRNPNALPLRSEDGDHGYWDAQNRGNGRGNSFLMEGGEMRQADPVGKMPRRAEMEMLRSEDGPYDMDMKSLSKLPPEILSVLGIGGRSDEAAVDAAHAEAEARSSDPAYADALQEWTDEMGHPPITPEELAEVEEWAAQMAEAHNMAR